MYGLAHTHQDGGRDEDAETEERTVKFRPGMETIKFIKISKLKVS